MTIWTLAGRPVDHAYSILYADPPWCYKDKGGPKGQGGAAREYPTMKLEDLRRMPVGVLGSSDSVMFMWGTYPTLPNMLELMSAWGYNYKSIAFQWVKTYPSGQPRFGLGHWTRGNTEGCFLATRGKPHRLDAAVSQLILSEELVCSEIGKHSEKPAIVREKILRLMGDLPAAEIFARKSARGWDSFGNEMPLETSLQYRTETK